MEAKIEIPQSILQKMRRYPLINWNEVIAQDLILRVSERDLVEEILKKSKLTEKDAEEIGKKIKQSLHKRYNDAESNSGHK